MFHTGKAVMGGAMPVRAVPIAYDDVIPEVLLWQYFEDLRLTEDTRERLEDQGAFI